LGPRILEDDRTLWLQAYQEHGPSILAFLTSRVGRREVAEEFLQETFVRAMSRGAGVASGPHLRSYLFTTAHHLVISDRRRGRVRLFSELTKSEEAGVSHPAAVEEHSSEAALDLGKMRERLDGALGTLSAAHREAFQAAVLEQKPYADIARERGWTMEQVKINVHRARKQVIALLRDLVRPPEEIHS
jgi:RNA polymerase sigma-70 factor (ECF subfamily)